MSILCCGMNLTASWLGMQSTVHPHKRRDQVETAKHYWYATLQATYLYSKMWNVWWCRCLVFLRIGQVLSLEAYTPAHDRPNGIAHINISEWRVSNHHPAATHTHTGERAAAESHVHPSQEVEDGTLRTITLFPPLSESTRHPKDRDGIELRVQNGGAYTGTKRGGWDEEGECTKYFRPPPPFSHLRAHKLLCNKGVFSFHYSCNFDDQLSH